LAGALADAGYRIIAGGTDTHVFLMDVFGKGIRGKEAQTALEKAHITANRNAIPFDQNPPFNPSGMRFGTPAVTTRGMGIEEMKTIAMLIAQVLENINDDVVIEEVWRQVAVLTQRFPLYAWKR
jgi:glycine hydroxymethyltransferase